jgi:hypothetical protein
MISKEERAELRLELSNASLGFPLPWRLGETADIIDADGGAVADCMVENRFTGSNAERYIVAAVNAAPALLDGLDASDERIAGLEAEVAELEGAEEQRAVEEQRHEAQFYVCEECGERKHNSNGGTDDEACDQCVEIRLLNARIAELEAAAQWRPIEEAPKDGKDWFIVARAGTPFRGPAYWFHGRWCQGNNAELHFTPTHFCKLPDGLPHHY